MLLIQFNCKIKAFVQKVGKRINLLATELAITKQEINILKAINEELRLIARKKVKKDP